MWGMKISFLHLKSTSVKHVQSFNQPRNFFSTFKITCMNAFLTWLRIRPHFLPIFSIKSKIGKFQVFSCSIIESKLSMTRGSGARIGLSYNEEENSLRTCSVFLQSNLCLFNPTTNFTKTNDLKLQGEWMILKKNKMNKALVPK